MIRAPIKEYSLCLQLQKKTICFIRNCLKWCILNLTDVKKRIDAVLEKAVTKEDCRN